MKDYQLSNLLAKSQRLGNLPFGQFVNSNIIIEKADSAYLFDTEGKRYLDFANNNRLLTYNHPQIQETLQEESRKLISSINFTWQKNQIDLADKIICSLDQVNSNSKILFTNSSSDAFDTALRMAKTCQENRNNIISFNESFFGHNLSALAVSAFNAQNNKNCLFSDSNIYFIDYPNILNKQINLAKIQAQFEKIFELHCQPDSVFAIVIESILFEAGLIQAPADFWKYLQTLCDRFGIILILDERQTAFGRTGKLFYSQSFGFQPDIIIFGDNIAQGLPFGGLLIQNERLTNSFINQVNINSLACGVALSTLNIIEQEMLYEKTTERGKKIQQSLKDRFGDYLEILGQGFLIGLMPKDKDLNIQPILSRALVKGLMVLSCGRKSSVIRLTPPLDISDNLLNEGLSILEQIIDYEILIMVESHKFRTK